MEIEKNLELLRNHILLKYGNDNFATADNYRRCLWKFLNHFKNYSQPKAIKDEDIIKYLLTISGRSNRCTHHSAIKKFYYLKGQAHKFKYIPYPEKEEKLPIHVNKHEFLQMINVCENNKHRAIIALMFDSGLRVSEVINLKIFDLDESNMIINVVQGKGRKDRKVKLTKVLLGILLDYMTEYNPTIYLFNGQRGAIQYSISSCQSIVRQLTKKAGIKKKFSPHKLRHGFAMTLLENKTTLDEIGNQLGHHSTKTTQIYARINNTVIQKIESPLEQIMKETKIISKNILIDRHTETILSISTKINLPEISNKVYEILFNAKSYILKEVNNKITEAPEGARWSIGVKSEKALGWFKNKGARISELIK